MNLDWTCNKCLKVFPEMTLSFLNSIKGFRFCEKCFDHLKSIDEKLVIDWQLILPKLNKQEDSDEICSCDCCDHC